MRTITFTNSAGLSITLGDSAPYVVLQLDGDSGSDVNMKLNQSPFQDGRTYTDGWMDVRHIDMNIAIMGTDKTDIRDKRRGLSQIFNPKLGPGTITYEYDGGSKTISAIPEKSPVFPDGGNNFSDTWQLGTISLTCPSPFWLESYEDNEIMQAWIGGLSFVLVLPTSFATKGSERIVINNGDVSCPVTIEFNGPASNPRVDNETTGEFIRIKRDLAAGEKLVISTEFGNKKVTLVDASGVQSNAMNWIDLDSTFWQLISGENLVKYSSDTGTEQATVLLTWTNRYIGV